MIKHIRNSGGFQIQSKVRIKSGLFAQKEWKKMEKQSEESVV